MLFVTQLTGTFKVSFERQLQSISKSSIRNEITKFSFLLPGTCRFPYTNYTYLYNELLEAFNSFYSFEVQILYIKPNCNDDHYIEVAITTT